MKDVNPEKDYKHTVETDKNGIHISYYGTGYGTYGDLIDTYTTGDLGSILDANDEGISVTTNTTDTTSSTANEIYITLTINSQLNSITTSFDCSDTSQISSFRIFYTDANGTENSIASGYKQSKTYTVGAYAQTVTLYVKQNKYFSSSYKTKELQNQLTNNIFTVKQFIPS